MPSTHYALYYHFVFSTKDRRLLIPVEELARFHQYLGGAVREIGGIAHSVGGVQDHVHLFTTLPPSFAPATVMRELKPEATKWAKAQLGIRQFAWQEGYGVFTVSPPDFDRVNRYVLGQERRHLKLSFQDEYVWMLKKGMVEYDEQYLW